MKTLLLLAMFVASTTGCATSPVTSRDAKQVPSSQVLNPAYLGKTDVRSQRVLIIRDKGFMGGALEAVISINRSPAIALNTGEKAVLYLAPGKYIFSVQAKRNFLGEAPGESEVEIATDRVNNFRLRLVSGDGPRIERTQFAE